MIRLRPLMLLASELGSKIRPAAALIRDDSGTGYVFSSNANAITSSVETAKPYFRTESIKRRERSLVLTICLECALYAYSNVTVTT